MKVSWITRLLISVIACGALFVPLVSAQTSPAGLFGEQHTYTLQLRGNGEAVVTLKQIFSNNTSGPLTSVQLRVPKVAPQDITAIQVIREPRCLEYSPMIDQPANNPGGPQIYLPPPCRAWEGYGNSTYQKAATNLDTDTITVELPKSIAPNQSGSIILFYRAPGYAKRNIFGYWDYTFETLKTEDKIRDLTIGVNVDNDYFLKGAKGQTNYRFEDMTSAMKMAPEMARSDTTLDNFVNYQIGQGTIVKKASNLQALDSYTVKGAYADAVWKLYALESGVVGIIIIGVLILVVLVGRSIFKSALKHNASSYNGVLIVVGTSFLSALSMVVLGAFLIFTNRYITPSLPYEYMSLIMLFTFITFVGLISLLILGPPLLIGVRRGMIWGLGTFAATVGFLVLFLILTVIFLMITRPINYPYPIPMMGRAEKTVQSGVDVAPPAVEPEK